MGTTIASTTPLTSPLPTATQLAALGHATLSSWLVPDTSCTAGLVAPAGDKCSATRGTRPTEARANTLNARAHEAARRCHHEEVLVRRSIFNPRPHKLTSL